jgi:hypothetical protein
MFAYVRGSGKSADPEGEGVCEGQLSVHPDAHSHTLYDSNGTHEVKALESLYEEDSFLVHDQRP